MVLDLYYQKDKIEAGIDEVGRGCLYGPVYAAAVILPQDFTNINFDPTEIKDSKKLSAKKRFILAKKIKEIALDYSIGFSSVEEIDSLNIFRATIKAMHRALDNLTLSLDIILVDGDRFKQYLDNDGNFISYECFPKGDNHYLSIACASILAKTERDQFIIDLVKKQPELEKYGLITNKGYGTKKHIDAIEYYGIVNGHRKTFAPCKNK